MYFIISVMILFVGCMPPQEASSVDNSFDYSNVDFQECELLLSFAGSNYSNQDYKGAIANYQGMLNAGCGRKYASDVYQWMGRSYIAISKNDSADYIFRQGLKFLPDDLEILEIAAWNAGKNEDFDSKINYLETILDVDNINTKALGDLNETYKALSSKDESYLSDQIAILDRWLKLDPGNRDANADKREAYSKLGKNPIDVDRERWLNESNNLDYGIDYLNSLLNEFDFRKIIDVGNQILLVHKFNKTVLKMVGDSYLNIDDLDNALRMYEKISAIDPSDFNIAMDVSQIFLTKGMYQESYSWADKAVLKSAGDGEAYYNRAEVLNETIMFCRKEILSCPDQTVYLIAIEDYKKAAKNGYAFESNKRLKFISEQFKESEFWFMCEEGNKFSKPKGPCYSWIERKIEK